MDDQTTRAGDPLAADTTDSADQGATPAPDANGAPVQVMDSAPAPDVNGAAMADAPSPEGNDAPAQALDTGPASEANGAAPDDAPSPEASDAPAQAADGAPAAEANEAPAQAADDASTAEANEAPTQAADSAPATDDAQEPAVTVPATPQESSPRSTGGGGNRGQQRSQGGRGGYGGSGSDMAALLAESEQQFRQLKYGDVLEGRIMRKDHDEILVDIGSKSEGVIPMSEASSLTPDELAALDIDDEVLVSVVQPENQEGHVVLSLDKARQERSWRNLQRKFEAGEILDAEVTGYNKGGLLVNLEGVRGFVPASQVSGLSAGGTEAAKQSELSRYTGQHLPLKIIEINRNRNRLILSERQAAQEQRDLRKEQLLSELHQGQIREGTVSSICDFGAFVDIGGADGLIHLSELSWSRVNHPSEVLKVGQPVNVFVMSVDERDRKIALSLKRTQPEPWSTVMDRYHLGQLVRGTITQLTDFGAFARLEDGIEGLIHVSELAEGRVTHPRNVVQEGWALTLRVIRIDPQRRRMGLSLKRAMEVQEGDTLEPQGPLPIIAPRPGAPSPEGAPATQEAGERPQSAQSAPPRGGGDRLPPRGGERGARQDRGGDRGSRGRDAQAEAPAPMPAQPEMTTSMAAALSAAMEAAEAPAASTPEPAQATEPAATIDTAAPDSAPAPAEVLPELPAPGETTVNEPGPGAYLAREAQAATEPAPDETTTSASTQDSAGDDVAPDSSAQATMPAAEATDEAPAEATANAAPAPEFTDTIRDATGPAEEAQDQQNTTSQMFADTQVDSTGPAGMSTDNPETADDSNDSAVHPTAEDEA